jgi:D-3-phosphoglycerate dehydrogenase
MQSGDHVKSLHVGFMMKWQSHERAFIERSCPPSMVCHFIEDDPREDLATMALLDVLVVGTQSIPAELIDAAHRLRLIQRWGTGLDNIDLAHCRSRGIATAELPGVNARSVSEFILCAMLALLRRLPDVTAAWAGGRWLTGPERGAAHRLEGKTVGLLGFGAIGQDVSRLLKGFSVETIYHDLVAVAPDHSCARPVGKDELLSRADVVCVQLPLTAQTYGVIGESEIASMKPSAVVISVSRSGVVDEAAVRAAVRSNRLFAASFDNFDQEPLRSDRIWAEPRILATPHMAGATVEGFQALVRACFESASAVRGREADAPHGKTSDPQPETPSAPIDRSDGPMNP